MIACSADDYHMFLNIPDSKDKDDQKCDRPTYQRTNERNLATIILDETQSNLTVASPLDGLCLVLYVNSKTSISIAICTLRFI